MKKEKLSHIGKWGIYIGILMVIFLPMLQQRFNFDYIKPLNGSFSEVKSPELTWKNWNKGAYQDSIEVALKAHTGFQPVFVRIHNQLDYSLFSKVNTQGVIVGKQGYMYELNYIKAHFGLDFVGKKVIDEQVRKLDEVRDSLRNHGIELLVVLAPGKGSYLPEFIPEKHRQSRIDSTNYDYYRHALIQHGINLFDAKKWFKAMKPTTPYPLYSKAGIHWSKYGEYLVVDSINHFLQQKGFKDMPYFKLDKINVLDENLYGDYDLGESLNLLFKVDTYPMGYPEFHVENTKGKQPKVMVVADSYYSALYFNYGMPEIAWGEGQYWYYNKEVFVPRKTKVLDASKLDVKKSAENHDVVILMITDANLYQFGFGWIESILKAYKAK